ncbi:MAG: DUF2281 domain-containing protein [bacterium]|jgi:hypothetical protein|nr:MAG: hypothetical protein DIU52_05915 [bacterium]
MHDIMRKRLWRKLEALPDEQLYQVLDFIEFLESKYAPGAAAEPGGLQRFAERVEDRMRARAISPRIMGGAMTLLGAASRVLDGIAQTGRELLGGGATGAAGRPEAAGNSRATGRGATPAPPGE